MTSRYFLSFPNFPLLFTVLLLGIKVLASSRPKLSYADHCGSLVPQYPTTGVSASSLEPFQISSTHFTVDEKLFFDEPGYVPSDNSNAHFRFQANDIHKTQSADILQIGGGLSIQGPSVYAHSSLVDGYHSKSVHSGKYMSFGISGFWSKSTGQICMLGTGSIYSFKGEPRQLSATFKLNYPRVSNISTSLVSGTVESLDPVDSLSFFGKISVLAYAQNKYSYIEFPPSIRKSCTSLTAPKETRGFESSSVGSYVPKLLNVPLKLEYGNDCSGRSCYPIGLTDGSPPRFLSLNEIHFSAEGKIHTLIAISNSTPHWYTKPLEPGNAFVGEGFWDYEKNQMCLLACHVLANASVGDCTIGLSLWFPLVLSLKSRSTVMGHLWSTKMKDDPPTFFSSKSSIYGYSPNTKYKYSVLDGTGLCDVIENSISTGYRTYPDGSSRQDLSLLMSLTRGETRANGHAFPLSLGETVFVDSLVEIPMKSVNVTQWNVSYEISYSLYNMSSPARRKYTTISAEGHYNSRSGLLCMVGCMHTSSVLDKQGEVDGSTEDCQVLINIQFPPLDPMEGEHLNGTIRSTRDKLDPLYFDPWLVSAEIMYNAEATKTIWRMDAEIIMLVVSLSFSCIFVRSQILYAKKHLDVLPDVSITMLAVVTLGYLIALILNFEAMLIMIQNRRNFLSWSAEWVVVKVLVARVLTLAAFLLNLHLLQVVWSARAASGRKKDLWVAEQKTLKLCLPLYLVVAAIASLGQSQKWRWEVLFSYAGCILDGFLFPQIMMNLFQRSRGKALALPFYVGMTAVRIFLHFYDLYRAHSYQPYLESSNIYAGSGEDFFSSSWDIIIPLAGILLAASIFMQQRFGGDCILPQRFKKQDGFVSVAELNL